MNEYTDIFKFPKYSGIIYRSLSVAQKASNVIIPNSVAKVLINLNINSYFTFKNLILL